LKFQQEVIFLKEFLDLCAANPLFENIQKSDLLQLLDCLSAKKRSCGKGEILFHTGDHISQFGIVLSGVVHTESTDILGERSIISYMNPGQFFCDAYSSTKDRILLVDIVAQTDCTVLLIETHRLLNVCGASQKYRAQLSENFISILAQKFVDLGCKVMHLSGRSTHRKLLSYLSEQYRFSDGRPFRLQFSQQELADYLFIERSGLSTELNKLKKEGILLCEKGLYSLRAPGGNLDID
jgi:CRP-like cAMP-binding protein